MKKTTWLVACEWGNGTPGGRTFKVLRVPAYRGSTALSLAERYVKQVFNAKCDYTNVVGTE